MVKFVIRTDIFSTEKLLKKALTSLLITKVITRIRLEKYRRQLYSYLAN